MYSIVCLCLLFSGRIEFLLVDASSGSNETKVESSETETNCSCTPPPDPSVTFNAPTTETWTFTYNGCGLELMGNPSTTNATITGGSLGSSKYRYYKFSFYWDIIKFRVVLVTYTLYYDITFGNFKNALKNGGGFLLIIPIEANFLIHNPQFDPFEEIFIKDLKSAGDSTEINSLFSYNFMKNFKKNAIYYSYTGAYCDEKTDECYTGVKVVQFKKEKWRNFISRLQYGATFEKLQPNPPPHVKQITPPVKNSGAVVNLQK